MGDAEPIGIVPFPHAPGCKNFLISMEWLGDDVTLEQCSACGATRYEVEQKPSKPTFLRRLWSRLTCRCEGVGLDDVCTRCGRPGDMGVM